MRRCGPAVAAVLTLVASGCGSSEPGPTATGDALEGRRSEEAEAVLKRLVNTDNGLEVRSWTVVDDAAVVGGALETHRSGEALSPDRRAALRRDGLRFVRVQVERLDELAGALGLGPVEVGAWHGQILTWRELRERPVGGQGFAVAAGGRVRRVGPGRLRLMARSWTVQMEDGPYLNLELLPEHAPPQGPHLRRLLGAQGLLGDIFPSARLEALLEPGYAYVLVSEDPRVEWPNPDGSPRPVGPDPARRASVGPGARAPETVGEVLLSEPSEPPARHALVFVPRIPAEAWQPYERGAGAASEPQELSHAVAE